MKYLVLTFVIFIQITFTQSSNHQLAQNPAESEEKTHITTSNPINLDISLDKYVIKEYLYNQIPVYYFIIAALIRYSSIRSIDPSYEDFYKTSSYIIKKRLSILQILLYLTSATLSLTASPKHYFGANYPNGSISYIAGALAWYLSYFLLREENRRGQDLSLYTHRIFWPSICCFQILCIFQEYMGSINIFMNSLKSLCDIILMIYALFKPNDKDEIVNEIPSFANQFFISFENNKAIICLFQLNAHPDDNNQTQKSPVHLKTSIMPDQDNNEDIQPDYDKKLLMRQLKNVQNQLPKSQIFLSQQVKKEKVEANQQIQFFYEIITKIDGFKQNTYTAGRSIQDCVQIQAVLIQDYNQLFPEIQYPKLVIINLNDCKDMDDQLQKQKKEIEIWLRSIFNVPSYIHKDLLDFLEVDSDSQAPYIQYFKCYQKLHSKQKINSTPQNQQPHTKIGISNPLQTNNFSQPETRPAVQQQTKESQQDIKEYINQNKNNFIFEVSCEQYQKAVPEFTFYFKIKFTNTGKNSDNQQLSLNANDSLYSSSYFLLEREKKQKQQQQQSKPIIWSIERSATQFFQLNKDLSSELNKKFIPSYQNNLAKLQNSSIKLDEKQKCLDQYLKDILQDQSKSYFCRKLFKFLDFDIIHERNIPDLYYQQSPRQSQMDLIAHDTNLFADDHENFNKDPNHEERIRDSDYFPEFTKNYIVEDLINKYFDFNRPKRISCQINFNFIAIYITQVRSQKINQEIEIYLDFVIKEFDKFGQALNKPLISAKNKSYKEIKELNKNIKSIFENTSLPLLPELKTGPRFDLDKLKNNLEKYFQEISQISQMENNRHFLKFFELKN